jgi:hypothetical protein
MRQTNERCWIDILDFLRYGDKRDMIKGFLVCKIWIREFGEQGQRIRGDLDYLRYK